jgi:hypothetical protein
MTSQISDSAVIGEVPTAALNVQSENMDHRTCTRSHMEDSNDFASVCILRICDVDLEKRHCNAQPEGRRCMVSRFEVKGGEAQSRPEQCCIKSGAC